MRRVAVLQPEDLSCDIRRNVLDVGRLDDLAVLLAEDLDRVVVVADGALVERALDTDWRAARRDGARKETAAKLDAEEWARSGRRLSRRRFGGGYSSIATQWVFDSAGLRQIRALDGNRGEQASRCDGTDAA